MIFSDLLLARRLEAAEAANAKGCTAIHPAAASIDVAGGCAVFVGAESPLTHAVGVGLNGPVSAEEIAVLEAFFRERGSKVTIDLCPLADAGLPARLADRGCGGFIQQGEIGVGGDGSDGGVSVKRSSNGAVQLERG